MRLRYVIGIGVFTGTYGLGCASSPEATPAAPNNLMPTTSTETVPSASNVQGHEVTIGLPVPALDAAVAWYTKLLGRELESTEPMEGIVELRIASGAWLQLFAIETEQFRATTTVLRFKTPNIDAEAARLGKVGIHVGEITRIPKVVAFTEFADPYGNPVSLYEVSATE